MPELSIALNKFSNSGLLNCVIFSMTNTIKDNFVIKTFHVHQNLPKWSLSQNQSYRSLAQKNFKLFKKSNSSILNFWDFVWINFKSTYSAILLEKIKWSSLKPWSNYYFFSVSYKKLFVHVWNYYHVVDSNTCILLQRRLFWE